MIKWDASYIKIKCRKDKNKLITIFVVFILFLIILNVKSLEVPNIYRQLAFYQFSVEIPIIFFVCFIFECVKARIKNLPRHSRHESINRNNAGSHYHRTSEPHCSQADRRAVRSLERKGNTMRGESGQIRRGRV